MGIRSERWRKMEKDITGSGEGEGRARTGGEVWRRCFAKRESFSESGRGNFSRRGNFSEKGRGSFSEKGRRSFSFVLRTKCLQTYPRKF